MHWIVFGDDWGAHPSTTQHLVNHLPAEDAVIWIDSIGMRSPSFSRADAARVWSKLKQMAGKSATTKASSSAPTRERFARIKPKVAPWHQNIATRMANRRSLQQAVRAKQKQLGVGDDTSLVLTANPLAVHYVDAFKPARVAYLRLDDYANLPGVDPNAVFETETPMYDRADAIFATARALLPNYSYRHKAHYLPQGVNWDHFAQVDLTPPASKVLGFFGLMAEWLDYGLVRQVAAAAPDWTLVLLGPVRHLPDDVLALANVEYREAVDFEQLPHALGDWRAAWIPFEVSQLTEAVNPLKAREYLAAGLPTLCTPLPEVIALRDSTDVEITDQADEVVSWLAGIEQEDTAETRQARRESVRGDAWYARAATLRERLLSGDPMA